MMNDGCAETAGITPTGLWERACSVAANAAAGLALGASNEDTLPAASRRVPTVLSTALSIGLLPMESHAAIELPPFGAPCEVLACSYFVEAVLAFPRASAFVEGEATPPVRTLQREVSDVMWSTIATSSSSSRISITSAKAEEVFGADVGRSSMFRTYRMLSLSAFNGTVSISHGNADCRDAKPPEHAETKKDHFK